VAPITDSIVSNFKNGKWGKPKNLKKLNSEYHESSASFTNDNQTIYFASDRPGGFGKGDLYKSTLQEDGKWGEPENLGALINTEYEEGRVYLHRDGENLYFSSKGHNSMGGYDIFKCTSDSGGPWGAPQNIGYPINTVDDDISFIVSTSKAKGYYSSTQPGGLGGKDIYMIVFLDFIKPKFTDVLEVQVEADLLNRDVLGIEEKVIIDSSEVAEQTKKLEAEEEVENLEFLKASLLEAEATVADLEAGKISEEDYINNLETQAAINGIELNQLREKLENADSAEAINLQAEIDLMESDIVALNDEIGRIEAEALASEIEASLSTEESMSSLQNEASVLEIDILDMEEKLKLVTDSTEIAAIEAQIAEKKQNLVAVNDKITTYELTVTVEESITAEAAASTFVFNTTAIDVDTLTSSPIDSSTVAKIYEVKTTEIDRSFQHILNLESALQEKKEAIVILEERLRNSETPEEIVDIISQIKDLRKEMAELNEQLYPTEQEKVDNRHVLMMDGNWVRTQNAITDLEAKLLLTSTPEEIVDLIIILEDTRRELELIEQSLAAIMETPDKSAESFAWKDDKEARKLALETYIKNLQVEIAALNERLAKASTPEEKKKLGSEIISKQEELIELQAELYIVSSELSEEIAQEFESQIEKDGPADEPVTDVDNDGVPDAKDKCPNEAGSLDNLGCPVKLYLMSNNLDTLTYATQTLEGVFEFKNLSDNQSHMFLLDAFNIDRVEELKIRYIDGYGKTHTLLAKPDDSGYFRYEYIPYTLHLFGENKDTLMTSFLNKERVFVFNDLRENQNYLFSLDVSDQDMLDKVVVQYTDENAKVNRIEANKGADGVYRITTPSTVVVEEIAVVTEEKTEEPEFLFEGDDPMDNTTAAEKLALGQQYLLKNILFDFDRATIKGESYPELERLAQLLKDNTDIKAEISGHTDHKGPARYNQLLSERRSASVVKYLISQGIINERLIIRGYGESKPIAPNMFPDGTDNPSGRKKNRRTEIKIIR
ncbi:MAG TPA: hypothetical protein EYN69_02265, partial [Flavobacteriales bacterium]|nr:hypothetical protein [Flavobacteriales bacterium]